MRSMFSFISFFFFKQKTAYEMRISDWSSDVCSSDLRARCVRKVAHPAPEIELESCDANADRVAGIGDRTHFGNANRRTWRAAASHIAVGAERRQPFGTLDSIKTTRLLYLRYGNGEIAVPLESGGNEGLQLRISEELPPADFHRPPTEHPVARVGGGVIPSGRQRWPRVRRG